jgi:hypothetical protein
MKNHLHQNKSETQSTLSPRQAERDKTQDAPVFETDALAYQRVAHNPLTATPADIQALQRAAGNRAVQRLLAQRHGDEDEAIQTKPVLQRVGPEGGQAAPEVEAAINRARGGGQPLDHAVQEQMGAGLGFDFGGVRVHADSEAHELNQQLSARAFTTGRDIFFGQGEYNPVTSAGRELIAHELTHVVQQSTGRVRGNGSGMTVRPAGDTFEQEADALSSQTEGSNRAEKQKRIEASPTVAELGYALVQPISEKMQEEGGTPPRAHRETAQGVISQQITGGAVQRAIADSLTEAEIATVNEGRMNCNQVVGFILKLRNKIAQNSNTFDVTANAIAWVRGGKEMDAPYTAAPEDSVIGIETRGGPAGDWRPSHVMLSVGGGWAYGINNGSIFGAQYPLWYRLQLSSHTVRPPGEIRMFYRILKIWGASGQQRTGDG